MGPRLERLKPYSDLLAEASKMASAMVTSLPAKEQKFSIYQASVSEAMQFLKNEYKESENQVRITESVCPDGHARVRTTSRKVDGFTLNISATKGCLYPNGTLGVRNAFKAPANIRLFYIPAVDVTSTRRLIRRRERQVCRVGRKQGKEYHLRNWNPTQPIHEHRQRFGGFTNVYTSFTTFLRLKAFGIVEP